MSNEEQPKEEEINLEDVPYTPLADLFALAKRTTDVLVTTPSGPRKVKIRSLNYGELQDCAVAGKDSIDRYRFILVRTGLIDPKIETEEQLKQLPPKFVVEVSQAITDFSGDSARVQKKVSN